MIKRTLLILSIFISLPIWAAETCSRVATINYQEVLVDVSSSNRGEGIRYYLEKDQIARELLDEYQENLRPTWKGATMSTLGSAMILGGLLGRFRNIYQSKFLVIWRRNFDWCKLSDLKNQSVQ